MPHIDAPKYRYCPFCGKTLTIRIEENRERLWCVSCQWTYYPRIATSAAAIIIKDNRVLMVKRNREPYKGTWMFPAGYIEFGEHPEAAIKREIKEETGLEVLNLHLHSVVQSVDDSREPSHLLFFYTVEVAEGELINDPEENQAIAWISLSEMPEIGWTTHQKMFASIHSLQD